MQDIVNSWWMYLLGVIVFLFVLTTSILFIYRSYKQSKEIGMDKSVIKNTIITSIIFSLLPSISILIGVIALSGQIGIPLPWIRLSVIGALHYEQTAVSTAYGSFSINELTPKMFVTVAFVMTIFILSGPIFCLIAFKKYDQKLLSKAKVEGPVEQTVTQVETAPKKKSFGPFLFSAAFIALVSSFLAEGIAKLKNVGDIQTLGPLETISPLIVALVAFGGMALFDLIAKKFKAKWLSDFALGFSMILGMASAVVVQLFF